jgi:hypothetical protein
MLDRRNCGHLLHPRFEQAGAQHSLSPMKAEIGAMIRLIKYPLCAAVDRKKLKYFALILSRGSPAPNDL